MRCFRIIVYFLIAAFMHSCANKVVPTGGPVDIEPPQLLKSTPPAQSVNFNSKSIILTFDEYIQLKEPARQIVISPPIFPAPKISVKKKSVVIELEAPLLDNTTYTINFSNAIVDNNENTPLAGFQYIFSTGSYIDSLKVTGTITDAQTLKPAEGALAMLYFESTHDSLILKKTPDYFSRSGVNGEFEISNVAPGRYRIFALLEKNNNYIFDQADDKVGFHSDAINITDSIKIDIKIYNPVPVKQFIKNGTFVDVGKLMTAFAKPVSDVSWQYISKKPDTIIPIFNLMKDTVSFYIVPLPADSVQIVWFEDGVFIDTISYTKPRILVTKPQAKFAEYTLSPPNNGVLTPESNPVISFSSPIVGLDTSLLKIYIDSTYFPANVNFTDSVKTKLELSAKWKEGVYKIQMLPGAVKDIYSLSNDSITGIFTVPSERSKGSITVKVVPGHQNNYLLQIVNDKDEVIRQRSAQNEFNGIFELLDPATYRLKMIIDLNGNNRWDPGDHLKNIQPEPVVYYTDPIMVRANWEVELEWIK